MLNAKLIAIVFGATFALVGIAGFIDNPLVSASGFFQTNWAHNLVHILTSVMFFAGIARYPGKERQVVMITGYFYVLVALLGFVWPSDNLLGFIHINPADRWLHLGLAAGIIFAGWLAKPAKVVLRTVYR